LPKITLDDLARIVNKRFDSVDDRFDGIDSRLDGIDNRLDQNESAISLIWQELKEINKKLDNLSDRTFEDSELAFKEIMQMKKRVGFLEEEVKKLKLSH
jgi:archaellum component FlaC